MACRRRLGHSRVQQTRCWGWQRPCQGQEKFCQGWQGRVCRWQRACGAWQGPCRGRQNGFEAAAGLWLALAHVFLREVEVQRGWIDPGHCAGAIHRARVDDGVDEPRVRLLTRRGRLLTRRGQSLEGCSLNGLRFSHESKSKQSPNLAPKQRKAMPLRNATSAGCMRMA